MARKVILDVDPGVADALAMCLALFDPRLEVVAVTATGGNVRPEQATRNVQAIVEQLDPPRWPRIGAADSHQPLSTDGRALWGPDGLCGASFRVAELHHRHAAIKVIGDEIKSATGQVTLIACGPLSNIASALQREPDLAPQVGHLFMVGGTMGGPGDTTAAAEFNVYCDPEAARYVFRTPVTKTLLPLDITSQVVLRMGVLDKLPDESTGIGHVLHAILPGAFLAYHQKFGLEGILIPEAVAVAAVLQPELFSTAQHHCDVEISGELTRGATVVDRRRITDNQSNMDIVVDMDSAAVLEFIMRGLKGAP